MFGRRAFLQSAGGALMAGTAVGASRALGAGSQAAGVGAGCTGATLTDGTIARFRSRIHGTIILPADAAYPLARRVYNQRFDPYPSLIVRPADESDIARTIEFADTNGIRLTIRSGGHSYIGASGGTGVVLDLSSMSAITPLGGAYFRVGAGAQLQLVYAALRCNGGWTIPSGSCGTVGFGGIAQGGGFGYLQRAHGLTCDRLRAARVVLADGRAVDASPEADADLHWALRGGGGGSFGVVTHFEVEAVPLRTIRNIGWSWPLSAADEVLAHSTALQSSGAIPPSITFAVVFNTGYASEAPPQCLGVLFSTGSAAEEQEAKRRFLGPGGVAALPATEFTYDAPDPACGVLPEVAYGSYRAKSAIVSGAVAADAGVVMRDWLQARLANPLLGAANPGSISFLSMGGAIAEVLPAESAFVHRKALFDVQMIGNASGTPTSVSMRANDAWLRGLYGELFPRLSLAGEGAYVNYADDDLPDARWPDLYWGANYPRLQATKLRVDPANFFRGAQTIRLPK